MINRLIPVGFLTLSSIVSFSQEARFKFIKNIYPEKVISINEQIKPLKKSGTAKQLAVHYFNPKQQLIYYVEYNNFDTILTERNTYNSNGTLLKTIETNFRKDESGENSIKKDVIRSYEYDENSMIPKRCKIESKGELNQFINYHYDKNGNVLKEELVNLIEQVKEITYHTYDESSHEVRRKIIEPTSDGKEKILKEFKIEVDYSPDGEMLENRRVYIKNREWTILEDHRYTPKRKMKEGFYYEKSGLIYNIVPVYEIGK